MVCLIKPQVSFSKESQICLFLLVRLKIKSYRNGTRNWHYVIGQLGLIWPPGLSGILIPDFSISLEEFLIVHISLFIACHLLFRNFRLVPLEALVA